MSDDVLLVDTDGPVTVLTINRPQALNALNGVVLAHLGEAVSRCADDPRCRVVVLTGAGDKAFCAGADLRELADLGPDEALQTMRHGQEAIAVVERARVPVVAAVNGLALGGGFELALAATFPILSERASLGLPESSLGLIPGYGGTQRLPRAVGRAVAAHLMLTGARLDAERAYELGLSPLAPVPLGDLHQVALEVAGRIASQGPRAVRAILQALQHGQTPGAETALALETSLAALAVAGEESTEGVAAFLGKRPAVFADLEEEPG